MSKSYFVRESSGLVKNVTLLDAISLDLVNMSAGAALFTGISPYIPPGGVIWLAAIIGVFLTLPQAYIYMALTGKIPRTGGDYVWLSRLLHGSVGTTMAFALMIESTAFFALTAFFFSSAVGTVLGLIGTLDGIQSLVSLSSTLSSPIPSYLLGAVLFAAIIAINIFKAKWGYTLVTISTIISLIGTIVAMVVIAVNIPNFNNAIAPFLTKMGVDVPSQSTLSSFAQQYPPNVITSITGILPLLAIFTFPWMQATPAAAAEAKKVRYAQLAILLSLLLTAILVILGFGLLYLAGGYAFTDYMFTSPNSNFVYTFWTVAIGLSAPAIQWIIWIGLMMWQFVVLAFGVIIFSRYIFAMAFDRVLPEIFTRVNKAGSPYYAHVFDLVLTLLFLVLPIVSTEGALSLYGAVVIGMIYFFAVSVAAMVYGMKNRNIAITAAGVFEAAYFIFLTYESVTNPVFSFAEPNGTPNLITLGFVVGSFAAGLGIYLFARYWNRTRHGINIDLIYKEIPPE